MERRKWSSDGGFLIQLSVRLGMQKELNRRNLGHAWEGLNNQMRRFCIDCITITSARSTPVATVITVQGRHYDWSLVRLVAPSTMRAFAGRLIMHRDHTMTGDRMSG